MCHDGVFIKRVTFGIPLTFGLPHDLSTTFLPLDFLMTLLIPKLSYSILIFQNHKLSKIYPINLIIESLGMFRWSCSIR